MVKKREHSAVVKEDPGLGSSALVCGGHDYSMDANDTEEFPPLPLTPSKSPVSKKKAQEAAIAAPNEDNNAQLVNLINTRFDATDDTLSGLSRKVDVLTDDMKAVGTKMAQLEEKVNSLEQPIKVVQRRVDELESYTRRWNLKLMGVPESEKENARLVVIKICEMVLPAMKGKLVDAIDTVHRLGNKRQATNNAKPRAIILQFVSRVCRDAVWKAAKGSPYMKEHGLQFKEDFSKGDRERRQRLWPEVQKARAAGKVAYYAGARVSCKEKAKSSFRRNK